MSRENGNCKIYYLIFFIIALTTSGLAKGQPEAKVHIDPSRAIGGSISQVFDSVTYIPLETNKHCLFGKIDQLIVTDSFFIILDRQTNTVLLFTRTGKFYTKFSGGKQEIQRFEYNATKQLIIMTLTDKNLLAKAMNSIKAAEKGYLQLFRLAHKYSTLMTYDINNRKLLKIKNSANNKIGMFGNTAVNMGNQYSVLYESNANKRLPDSIISQLYVFKDDSIHLKYFDYNIQKDIVRYGNLNGRSGEGGIFKSAIDTVLLFTRPFDYNIYELSPNRLFSKYQLIFPLNYTIPNDYFVDSSLSESQQILFFKNHPNFITSIDNIHLTNKVMILNLHYPFSVANNLVYWFKSGTLCDFLKIVGDSFNNFLPIVDQYNNNGFNAFFGTFIYTQISSLRMFQAMESTKDKHSNYPPVLQEYFRNQSRKSNPVIVQLKPKDNL